MNKKGNLVVGQSGGPTSVINGSLAGVMQEALEFCFESACHGTIAEGAALEVNSIPARGSCRDCGLEFDTDSYLTACPNCSGFKVDIIQGQELRIKSINVD